MMRLDQSYTTNRTEQARGGQKEMHVPLEVDKVAASQNRKVVKMWTRFEEGQCARIAG